MDLMDGQEIQHVLVPRLHSAVNNQDIVTPLQVSKDTITTINQCTTKEARYLCIYDFLRKLKYNDEFDIGGTYSDCLQCFDAAAENLEFWFVMKTCSTFDSIHLLSLFVIARKIGKFSIGVSGDNSFYERPTTTVYKQKIDWDVTSLGDKLSWYSFNNTKENKLHYIKTYSFKNIDLEDSGYISVPAIKKSLYIPIVIKDNVNNTIQNLIKSIKITHNIGEHLYNEDNKDFTLEANTGNKIKIHKVVLAALSPVFRLKLKNKLYVTEKIENLNMKEMEIFVEFLYKAKIKDLLDVNYSTLMEVAFKYQIKSLMVFVEHIAGQQLNVENVVDIAIVAQQYNLSNLLRDAFEFILLRKEVLHSDGWKKLNNASLPKKLFEYIQQK